jgi:hypothetical protein
MRRDARFQVFKTLPVIPPLTAESRVRCNLIAPQEAMAPFTDASDDTEPFPMSFFRSYSLDGSVWIRRGTMTYPRIPYKE